MLISASGAALDLCVLAIIAKGDAYGYTLTQRVNASLEVSESTIYPVMRRLTTHNCLETYDTPHEGRLRRYYRLTDTGRETLAKLLGAWRQFVGAVDEILVGGETSGAED
ncbi:MAG: PadR family transcriptional regulator [Oscillospiraceae bacterium]|jgi:PadR family transcriptional regulator PadR|nr:PadR family transcriptional regulator [Oscillospiraceae bacterium]